MSYLDHETDKPLLAKRHSIGVALEAAGMAIHDGRLEIRELRTQSHVDEALIADWRSGVASARLEQRALLGELATARLELIDYRSNPQGWMYTEK